MVFKEITPNRQDLVISILEEAKLWMLAGAKALRRLPQHSRPPRWHDKLEHVRLTNVSLV
jgi:hypothetical protein